MPAFGRIAVAPSYSEAHDPYGAAGPRSRLEIDPSLATGSGTQMGIVLDFRFRFDPPVVEINIVPRYTKGADGRFRGSIESADPRIGVLVLLEEATGPRYVPVHGYARTGGQQGDER
jgi:hypothetical protein